MKVLQLKYFKSFRFCNSLSYPGKPNIQQVRDKLIAKGYLEPQQYIDYDHTLQSGNHVERIMVFNKLRNMEDAVADLFGNI